MVMMLLQVFGTLEGRVKCSREECSTNNITYLLHIHIISNKHRFGWSTVYGGCGGGCLCLARSLRPGSQGRRSLIMKEVFGWQ
jgi:hypothetical protein